MRGSTSQSELKLSNVPSNSSPTHPPSAFDDAAPAVSPAAGGGGEEGGTKRLHWWGVLGGAAEAAALVGASHGHRAASQKRPNCARKRPKYSSMPGRLPETAATIFGGFWWVSGYSIIDELCT